MRVMFAICAGILMSTAAVFGETLPVSGQVVDSTARPVEGAEVAVYEQYLVGLQDYDARLAAPIVRTDAQGRFTLEADISGAPARIGTGLGWTQLRRQPQKQRTLPARHGSAQRNGRASR